MSIDNFTRERIERSQSNMEVKPAEILRFLLNEIECGRENPTGVLIQTFELLGKTTDEVHKTFRAGVPRHQELVMLEYARQRWLG